MKVTDENMECDPRSDFTTTPIEFFSRKNRPVYSALVITYNSLRIRNQRSNYYKKKIPREFGRGILFEKDILFRLEYSATIRTGVRKNLHLTYVSIFHKMVDE